MSKEITAGQAIQILETVTAAGAVEAARWELAAELTEDLPGREGRSTSPRPGAAAGGGSQRTPPPGPAAAPRQASYGANIIRSCLEAQSSMARSRRRNTSTPYRARLSG